ncbi:MAG: pyridoxal phosphate-dependent aminotransferase [Phycisphaerales bacterium]|nr:pyridoxal phosphate-dependent aminotransferase [Phycisphaerales bacterium]
MKLSQRVQSIGESATLAVAATAARLKAQGVDVISFGAGEPDFPTPQHIVRAGQKALDDGRTKYPKPASGIPALKDAVCAKLKRENRLDYRPEQIVITVGGKMACQLSLLAILDPGDEVIIPVPYWVSYPDLVRLAGAVPVFVTGEQSNGFRVTPHQLREAVTPRTRAFIFNSPSNPTGHIYAPDEVHAMARVFAGSDITVLSDEIYDRLVFDGEALSFAAVDADAYRRTITVNSASKTYAMTGWRLGFVAGPMDVVQAIANLQTQGTSGAPEFCQVAYAAALTGDQRCAIEMRDEFARRGRYMCDRLNAMPGVRSNRPQGAFYVFPNVSETYRRLGVRSSVEFAERLLTDAAVAVVPGSPFGMDTHVRLSFATSMEQIEAGMSRLDRFLRQLAPQLERN